MWWAGAQAEETDSRTGGRGLPQQGVNVWWPDPGMSGGDRRDRRKREPRHGQGWATEARQAMARTLKGLLSDLGNHRWEAESWGHRPCFKSITLATLWKNP